MVDELQRHSWVPEEKLAELLHLHSKQLRRVLNYLREQHVLKRMTVRTTKKVRALHLGIVKLGVLAILCNN